MNLLTLLKRQLAQVAQVRINPSSLQFRLTVGIIIIFIVAYSGFNIWLDWEIKKFFMITYQEHGISFDDPNLSVLMQNVRTVSILVVAITTTIANLLVKRSLLPLHQMNQWATTYAQELSPYQPRLTGSLSEVKAIAKTWSDLLVRLTDVREQQRQFTNDLAHELRSPLSMVYAYLQRTWQRSHNLSDAQKEALAMAVADAERMNQILQDLLDLARAGSIAMPLQTEQLILNDVIADMAQMSEKFAGRSILLELASFPIKAQADRTQLMQILNHLIDNAVKHSDIDETITLQLTQADAWAVIQVIDRGCGIPLAEQSRIFEPFYRVDTSRTRTTGGTGLGLSIVKRLVERMGGQVGVRSEPGYGSTFIFKLPAIGT
ncbi:integral membrane sensor signal transduction histidine kinase [Nostoc sp. NIES-3756]|uniref:sensor histidine kinase n=1 Tax=Nostoc sp. NIES-3756 TaxID=1751286 RepID=UPI0007212233|nr:HAMP domain-containing sensor histidine kinase [Nostoc sp. NIES-3756]BAT52749.1 integral membrane sensor signal transduction histidine kinase [Nostoc sp. NIES-3756]